MILQGDLPLLPEAAAEVRFPFGLSVFFPAYNDAPSLPLLLARTMAVLTRLVDDCEIIVVNDGSTDNTAEVLDALSKQYFPRLHVITHDRNRGYGAALRSGFEAATKDYVFYTDGDGQYDPAELEQLLTAVTPGTGLVNGYKRERSDPWHRVVIGWLYNRFARALFGVRLRDIDCDFRLIRRDLLHPERLRSTAGAICVELVRQLELSGSEVVELPVHHYPRQHGRSQFFRVRSLVSTFAQLCAVFTRLAVMPVSRTDVQSRPSARTLWVILAVVTFLSFLAYGRALTLPPISDDYDQIQKARLYGPLSSWADMWTDALYRCRATSLILTYWTERIFGIETVAFNLSSLVLHILNSLLVFAMGYWRPIGWKVAAIAACYFAVSQRHSEAVIWYAAIPELLVFLFSLSSFLLAVHWLQAEEHPVSAYLASFICFLLALYSKESGVAVVPLLAMAILINRERAMWRLLSLAPFGIAALAYFGMAYAARSTHQHFSDGTFDLQAPFWNTVPRSVYGLLWVWGFVALGALIFLKSKPWNDRRWMLLMSISGIWMVITLLPYSFLTYMPHVPSRHTYFASFGASLIVAAGMLVFGEWASRRRQTWLIGILASVIVLQESMYLWIKKHGQYASRAEPTEALVRLATQAAGPIYASCFPYPSRIGDLALELRVNSSQQVRFLVGPEAAGHPNAVDFCNEVANAVGVRPE